MQRMKISCIVGYVYNRYHWIELVKKTGFPTTKVLQTLVLLQLGGHIREIRKNEYVRTDSRIIDGEVFSNRGVTGKGEEQLKSFWEPIMKSWRPTDM